MNKKLLFIIIPIVIIIVIGIILFALSNRGGSSNTGSPTNTSNTSGKKTEITYWGLWESEEVMQPIIADYESKNPDVKILYTQKTFTQYEDTLYTRVQQSSTQTSPLPDIVRLNNTWLSKFQKYLEPVPTSIMTSSDFQKSFYLTAVSDFTGTDGKLYAIPIEIDGLVLFYNKDLLQEAGIETPPEDWDSIIDVAKQLTKTDSTGKITQAGLAMGTSNNVKHSADILNLLFMQNNVNIIDQYNTQVDLSEPRAQTALTFYTSFYSTHKTWSDDLPSDLELFYSGKLAMFFGPSWRAFDIIMSAPSIEFDTAPVPQVPTNDQIGYAMYWGEAVPKGSANKEAAWKFIKYLSEPAQQEKLYSSSSSVRAFGEPYSRVELASKLKGKPYVDAVITQAPYMTAWKMGEQAFVEETFRELISNVIVNDMEPATALAEAEVAINDKLNESVNSTE